MAGEEGVGIQRKLHTGRVRDGLAKQNHDSGSSWRALLSIKWTHVTCAVEDLQQQKRKVCQILRDVERKTDLDRYKCTVFNKSLWGYWTFHSADLMLTVRPLLVRVLFIRRKKLMSLGISFISFFFKPENNRSRRILWGRQRQDRKVSRPDGDSV